MGRRKKWTVEDVLRLYQRCDLAARTLSREAQEKLKARIPFDHESPLQVHAKYSFEFAEEWRKGLDIRDEQLTELKATYTQAARTKKQRLQDRNIFIDKLGEVGINGEEEIYRLLKTDHPELIRKGKNGFVSLVTVMKQYRSSKSRQ